ncbi:hypothetical protein COO60DRAFT_1090268 [Scenedesmus sp. NREL 46B-D3]|nr:hypothetical protein COO60DRAFT_1090268 [Scenedesmus sp. NREL 46B-D3]
MLQPKWKASALPIHMLWLCCASDMLGPPAPGYCSSTTSSSTLHVDLNIPAIMYCSISDCLLCRALQARQSGGGGGGFRPRGGIQKSGARDNRPRGGGQSAAAAAKLQ